jgi:hypothetical protein
MGKNCKALFRAMASIYRRDDNKMADAGRVAVLMIGGAGACDRLEHS